MENLPIPSSLARSFAEPSSERSFPSSLVRLRFRPFARGHCGPPSLVRSIVEEDFMHCQLFIIQAFENDEVKGGKLFKNRKFHLL